MSPLKYLYLVGGLFWAMPSMGEVPAGHVNGDLLLRMCTSDVASDTHDCIMYLSGVLDTYVIQLEARGAPACPFAEYYQGEYVIAEVVNALKSDPNYREQAAAGKILEILPKLCSERN